MFIFYSVIQLVIFFFYFLGIWQPQNLQNGLNVYYCMCCLQYILTRLKHIHLVTSCIARTSDIVVFTLFCLHFCSFLVLIASPNPHTESKLRLSALLDIYLKVIHHLAKFQGLSDLTSLYNCDFVILTQFWLHFGPFWALCHPKPPYME